MGRAGGLCAAAPEREVGYLGVKIGKMSARGSGGEKEHGREKRYGGEKENGREMRYGREKENGREMRYGREKEREREKRYGRG